MFWIVLWITLALTNVALLVEHLRKDQPFMMLAAIATIGLSVANALASVNEYYNLP